MQQIRWPYYLVAFLSLAIALVSYRFLALALDQAFVSMTGHLAQRRLALILHVSAAPIALATGVLQFLPGLRARRPGLHRWTGRVYAFAVLIAGGAGLLLAIGAEGGRVAGLGFGLLAVVWLAVTGQAVRLAMARRIALHRRWMIRSFALTFAAVTLRIYLPFFIGLGGLSYAQASLWVAWLCWVPNLLLVEWWLARR